MADIAGAWPACLGEATHPLGVFSPLKGGRWPECWVWLLLDTFTTALEYLPSPVCEAISRAWTWTPCRAPPVRFSSPL